MNDTFGNISQDFLPPDYGGIESKVIQRVGEDAPTMEALDNPEDVDRHYAGIGDWKIFGGEGRSSGEEEVTETATTTETADEQRERGAFWEGLGSSLTGMFGQSAQAATLGEEYCTRSGKDAWTYHQYPDGSVVVTAGPSHVSSTRHSATSSWGKGVKALYGACDATGAASTASGTRTFSPDRGAAIGAGIGAFGAQLLPALASILGPQEITPFDDEHGDTRGGDDPGGGTNWGLIIGGVAIVGLIGAGIFMVTRDDD